MALWQKLSTQIEAEKTVNHAPFILWRLPAMRYATVALSLILALGIGAGAYAYSSPEVNEVHPLYSLKKNMEKIEERIVARSPERKAAWQAKQMRRRLAEIERLQARKLNFEKTLDELNETEESGLKTLNLVTSSETRGMIKQRIEMQVEARQKRLEEAKKILPPAAERRIEAVMQKRAKRLEVQAQKWEEQLEQMRERRQEILEKQINILPNRGRAEEKTKRIIK